MKSLSAEFGELPGGELEGGNIVRPAIVVNPDLKLRVVTEEQFGPVIPVIPFDTEAEAVHLANDNWAGLSGSVWTADPQAADRVGGQLVCGNVGSTTTAPPGSTSERRSAA